MKVIAFGTTLVIAITSLSSCSGSIPNPTEADAALASQRWSGTTVHNLMAGRKLYIERCGACHSLSTPKQYSAAEWEQIVEKMKARALLNEEEKTLVIRFLITLEKHQTLEKGY